MHLLKENGSDIRGITCDYNCVFRSNGSIAMWWGYDSRRNWAGGRYTSMTAWKSATPFSDFCIQTNPQFAVGAGSNFALKQTSPAVNRGRRLTEVAVDYSGVARPRGTSHDMGAYEY